MKLATINDGTRDGRLAVVSADLSTMADAGGIAATLQNAIERWEEVEPQLLALSRQLESGTLAGAAPFDPVQAMAPLPRAWQWLDGSAFQSHGDLMSTVFGTEKLAYDDRPLMYQGMSDSFLASHQDVRFPSEQDGIDLEGEFGVIVGHVPMGTSAAEAIRHIKLLVLINDWSLRAIAPVEMKTGFGWVQAKPACSVAPVAVTPDELGGHWRNGRIALNLDVAINGARFGAPNGEAMAFGFDQLIAHAARSRDLVAGTIIGSGTVSNADYREVGSACITERRAIEMLDEGAARTPFLHFGDRVRLESRLPGGGSIFGAIDQAVVQA